MGRLSGVSLPGWLQWSSTLPLPSAWVLFSVQPPGPFASVQARVGGREPRTTEKAAGWPQGLDENRAGPPPLLEPPEANGN